MGCHSLLQEIFQPRDRTRVSCIGRQILLPLSNLGSHTGTYILIQPHWYIYLSGPNSLFHWHRKFLFCPNESVDQRIGMSKDMCKLLWRREVSSLNQDKLHCICTVLWREQGLCSWTHMDSTPPVSNY